MSKFRIKTIWLLILSLLWSVVSIGQIESHFVSPTLNNSGWLEFMEETQATYGVTYYLQTDSLVNMHIKIPSDTLLLLSVLKSNLEPLGYKIALDGHGSIFITNRISIKTNLPLGFFTKPGDVSDEGQVTQNKTQDGRLTTSKVYIAKRDKKKT